MRTGLIGPLAVPAREHRVTPGANRTFHWPTRKIRALRKFRGTITPKFFLNNSITLSQRTEMKRSARSQIVPTAILARENNRRYGADDTGQVLSALVRGHGPASNATPLTSSPPTSPEPRDSPRPLDPVGRLALPTGSRRTRPQGISRRHLTGARTAGLCGRWCWETVTVTGAYLGHMRLSGSVGNLC
jgi:hypothetical protein